MTKVAILGGGVGGATAAFELTATPELRERFDVTLYQLGWRLGGKGASGRNAAAHDRIEEHGLHVWFGFYDHAFRVMRDAYSELGRPAGSPLASFEDAFKGCDQLVLYDLVDGKWHANRIDCPRNVLRPGDVGELPTSGRWPPRPAVGRWRAGASFATAGTTCRPRAATATAWCPTGSRTSHRISAGELLEGPVDIGEQLLGLAERLAGLRARYTDHLIVRHAAHPALLVRLLKAFREWLWTSVVAGRIDRDPELRFYFTAVDAGVSTVAGNRRGRRARARLRRDQRRGVVRSGCGSHGASEVTLGRTPAERSPVLRAVYDVAFGYTEGDIAKANCAAGTATKRPAAAGLQLPRLDHVQDAGGDGRHGVRAPLRGPEAPRRRVSSSFTPSRGSGLAADSRHVDTIEVVPQVGLNAADVRAPAIDAVTDGASLLAERAALGSARRAATSRARAACDFEGRSEPAAARTPRP